MKFIIFVFTISVGVFGIKVIEKKRNMELVVFDMYLNNFEEYLLFDEKNELDFDKELMKNYFKEKGYHIKFKEGKLEFIVSFKMIINCEQKYSFYLEKSDEFE